MGTIQHVCFDGDYRYRIDEARLEMVTPLGVAVLGIADVENLPTSSFQK